MRRPTRPAEPVVAPPAMPGTITPPAEELEAVCMRPTTRAAMLDLVSAWRRIGWIGIEEKAGGELRVYSLTHARTLYKDPDRWKSPAFERNPELREAAQLFASIDQVAKKAEELYSLTIPGDPWQPEGLAEAWTALHRILKRARAGLPKLAEMP